MIIKRVAVGNDKEAYIESSIMDSINIISSDDNNKGKTILIQSLIYCLGNVPVFPSSFDYDRYYFYIEFAYDKKNIAMCRKGNTFVILNNNRLMPLNSVSELKRYWSKHIFPLPQIVKKDVFSLVAPELFVQIYFMGQDKKDTSNIANKGYYSKDDFMSMLFALSDLGPVGLSHEQIAQTKEQINELKSESQLLQKQNKILKSTSMSSTYLSQHNDRVALIKKFKMVEGVKNKLSELRSYRSAAMNRKVKYEVTLKELNSLNRTISGGELRCLECKSNRIGFAAQADKPYAFDISTPEIRKQIIESINEKISSTVEDIDNYTLSINEQQERLQQLLADDDVTLEALIIHRHDLLDSSGVEIRLSEIDSELDRLSSLLLSNEESSQGQLIQQRNFIESIFEEMNNAYSRIDPSGTLIFDSLFTKRDEIFSGSEATEFHLLKLYAIAKVLKHSFPIIVDSFRAEDLSTERENAIIDIFLELRLQTIFTTTLKAEEEGKYNSMLGINHIDYSCHEPSKLLRAEYAGDFVSLLEKLSISI